jgi:hypothetical protein
MRPERGSAGTGTPGWSLCSGTSLVPRKHVADIIRASVPARAQPPVGGSLVPYPPRRRSRQRASGRLRTHPVRSCLPEAFEIWGQLRSICNGFECAEGPGRLDRMRQFPVKIWRLSLPHHSADQSWSGPALHWTPGGMRDTIKTSTCGATGTHCRERVFGSVSRGCHKTMHPRQ